MSKIKEIKCENACLKDILKKYESYFSTSQQEVILKDKCNSWNNEDIYRAIALKCISKKAFKYLKEEIKYRIPSESTLKRCLHHCIIKPRFIDLSLNVLKAQGRAFTDMERDAVVSFNEMKVKSDLRYDAMQDKILGTHSTIQVVMVRGIIFK